MLFRTDEKPEMNGYILELYTGMEESLQVVGQNYPDDLILQSTHSVDIINAALGALRAHVTSSNFRSEEEEIYFFKRIKPLFVSQLICFVRMFRLATEIPKALKYSKLKCLKSEQQQLEDFYLQHKDFCAYYRSNSDYLDKQYFVRGKIGLHSTRNPVIFSIDPAFSTSHDLLAAELIAADQLAPWLTLLIKQAVDEDSINIAAPKSADDVKENFVHTNFRAAEIYLFLKSLIDAQVIVNHTYRSFFELVVPRIGTKLNKNLTPASLLKYSDKVDPETRENVKRLLMKMIRNIDNY